LQIVQGKGKALIWQDRLFRISIEEGKPQQKETLLKVADIAMVKAEGTMLRSA
jgi:hypothetical protein